MQIFFVGSRCNLRPPGAQLKEQGLASAAAKFIRPDAVVGELAVVERRIRGLNLDEVIRLDGDGRRQVGRLAGWQVAGAR